VYKYMYEYVDGISEQDTEEVIGYEPEKTQ
jgi:hypothetical protein